MRVGVFGGSFDPIHHGHLVAARALLEGLGLDQVRLIPAAAQPLKGAGHGASPDDRARMAEMAVAGEPGLVVDRVELERSGPSFTVDTLRHLEARWPGVALTLLLGSDAARDFDRWRAPDEIRALAEVVVFPRGDRSAEGLGFRTASVPRIELSATEIRARVWEGRSIRYLVPETVADYIAARRLYRSEEG